MTEAERLLREVTKHLVIKYRAMILAQCYVESAKFMKLEESFAYRAQRLLEVFPNHVKSLEDAKFLVSQGHQAIANRVYANRMGNGNELSGDGWRYRGRGLIQLTGKNNYRLYGELAKKLMPSLLDNPDQASEPLNAAQLALLYFQNREGLMQAASLGNVTECTKLINGGTHALQERKDAYKRYIAELNAEWAKNNLAGVK